VNVTAICSTILELWDELGLEMPAPRDLSCLLRTPRFRASSHVLFFVFARGSALPILIAKTPRLPGDHAALEREATNLQMLASSCPQASTAAPRLLAYRDWHGSKLLLQSIVPGRPMSPAVVRRSVDTCTRNVMRWVTDLHFDSRSFSAGSGSVRRSIDGSLGFLRESFSATDELRLMLDGTQERVEPLATQVLPRVFAHGDLSSPNILMDDAGGIGIVDWELADPTGLPASDVFFFLTYIAFARSDATTAKEQVKAFGDAFFGSPAWARTYVMDYAKALGLSSRSLRPLFLLTWVRYVESLVVRLRHDGHGVLTEELRLWLTTNRYFALWKYTLEHWKELDI
jgi:aminoglycoside phosphotransferase (APT) family kinase protein